MRPCSPALLLALLLLVTASAAGAQTPTCQTGVRRIELSSSAAAPPELCISPGLTTTILFDQRLAQEALVLEGRERFQRVEAAGSMLVLVPSERLRPGERLRLTVRFAEASVSETASFVLVGYRDQAERQVEVSRPRSSDSCQVQLQRKEAELQRCVDQRESAPAQVNLARLLATEGLILESIPNVDLTFQDVPGSTGAMVERVLLYQLRSRSVMMLKLRTPKFARPLQLTGASLLASSGEGLGPLQVAGPLTVPPGLSGFFWVELEPGTRPGTYGLELWDEARQRTVTLKDLKLP